MQVRGTHFALYQAGMPEVEVETARPAGSSADVRRARSKPPEGAAHAAATESAVRPAFRLLSRGFWGSSLDPRVASTPGSAVYRHLNKSSAMSGQTVFCREDSTSFPQTSSKLLKKYEISIAAFSSESEPWTAFSPSEPPKSFLSVPASALAGSVAPIRSRHDLTALSFSSAMTTHGALDMNSVRPAKNGRSRCTA